MKIITIVFIEVPGLHALAFLVVLCSSLLTLQCSSPSAPAKNVIIMIADGMSGGSWDAAEYWVYGEKGVSCLSSFPGHYGVTTFPLNTGTSPSNDGVERCGYDPVRAWDSAPSASGLPFKGYVYLSSGTTDSAAAATAMASGIKTYNSAINYDNYGQPTVTILKKAKRMGKATGVVTTVEFCHATPAGFGAHSSNRSSYTDIAHEMLTSGDADLIMGCGHPLYDQDGRAAQSASYAFINESDWNALLSGTLTAAGRSWTMVQTKNEFRTLCTSPGTLPLFGIPCVSMTLQQGRTLSVQGADAANPSGIKFISSVPDLPTMSLGALNALASDPDGMFLMIEGGATDWAAHSHQGGQLIEEASDFFEAVDAVSAWIEMHSSWDETLLIVTTDHGNGLVLGPDASSEAFQPVASSGKGMIPGMSFQITGHTNELVRLWARGVYSAVFYWYADQYDENFSLYTGHNADGAYIDNTDIFRVMNAAVEGE